MRTYFKQPPARNVFKKRFAQVILIVLVGCLGVYFLNFALADNQPVNNFKVSASKLPPENSGPNISLTYNDYVYSLNYNGNKLIYARAGSDGSLGAWTPTTAPTTSMYRPAAVINNGYMYIIGGDTNSRGASSPTVNYAHISPNGSLGSWESTASLPQGIEQAVAVTVGNTIYLVGGTHSVNTGNAIYAQNVATVYYAHTTANGSLSAWQPAVSLPEPRQNPAVTISNGYLYVLGGQGANTGQGYVTDTAYFSRINGDGSLEAWHSTTNIPHKVQGDTALIVNGQVCEFGGQTYVADAANYVPEVNNFSCATVQPDGTLSAWMTSTLPRGVYGGGGVAVGNFVYVIGGETDGGDNEDAIFQAGINGNLPGVGKGAGGGSGVGAGNGTASGRSGAGQGKSQSAASGGGSPAATPTTPTASPQGTQTKSPAATPSPFFDGKQYAPGSDSSDRSIGLLHRSKTPRLILGGILGCLIVGTLGYLWWRRSRRSKRKK